MSAGGYIIRWAAVGAIAYAYVQEHASTWRALAFTAVLFIGIILPFYAERPKR